MRIKARTRALIASAATAISVMNGQGAAASDLIGVAGSYSVQIPMTPGDMSFTLTVNGQPYEFRNVDDSLGGTLTLSWAASQQAPRTSVQSCPGQAPGSQILVEEATPSASVWATWTSPTSHEVLGPVEIPSRPGFAVAGACLGEEGESPGDEDGDPIGGDPSGEDPSGGDPSGGDETPPCAQNQGNGNGQGNGKGNGSGGQGNGNSYGHLCD